MLMSHAQHDDEYDPTAARRRLRRGKAAVGAVGLAAILGGGAFLVTNLLTDKPETIATDSGALSPLDRPSAAPRRESPTPKASPARPAPPRPPPRARAPPPDAPPAPPGPLRHDRLENGQPHPGGLAVVEVRGAAHQGRPGVREEARRAADPPAAHEDRDRPGRPGD